MAITKKERDAQKALGNVEEYMVTVEIPIKLTVKIHQNVNALNAEDAIEQWKTLQGIVPEDIRLQEVIDKSKNTYKITNKEFDTTKERKFRTHKITHPTPGESCESAG